MCMANLIAIFDICCLLQALLTTYQGAHSLPEVKDTTTTVHNDQSPPLTADFV